MYRDDVDPEAVDPADPIDERIFPEEPAPDDTPKGKEGDYPEAQSKLSSPRASSGVKPARVVRLPQE
jgi:hypothetical protein